jgi:tetratricopeptide (TPR) repeat protein
MSHTVTFEGMARAFAEQGAAASCASQACALDVRAGLEPALRAEPLRRGALGLRVAAGILSRLAPDVAVAPFRPVGLRGAVAAGHVALAAGRLAQAELVGSGIAEAAPRSPGGLRLVGQALLAQGKHVLAVRALRGALAAAPDDPFTRALLAEALWFAGERGAARCALAAARAAPADPLAAALDAAIRCGALDGAGGGGCA